LNKSFEQNISYVTKKADEVLFFSANKNRIVHLSLHSQKWLLDVH